MASVEDLALPVTVIAILLAVITILELKYLRKVRRRRSARLTESEALPDRSHNAILAAKAIYHTLERDGMGSPHAERLIGEAEVAFAHRKHRTAIDLVERAKGVMKTERLRLQRMGDAAKLEASAPGSGEPTAKEVLQRKLPPNYAPSKFSMTLAAERILVARDEGRDISEAERLLERAQASFDGGDFSAALAQAVQSRKAADGGSDEADSGAPAPMSAPPVPVSEPSASLACSRCGAELLEGDAFCRKCGLRIG